MQPDGQDENNNTSADYYCRKRKHHSGWHWFFP